MTHGIGDLSGRHLMLFIPFGFSSGLLAILRSMMWLCFYCAQIAKIFDCVCVIGLPIVTYVGIGGLPNSIFRLGIKFSIILTKSLLNRFVIFESLL